MLPLRVRVGVMEDLEPHAPRGDIKSTGKDGNPASHGRDQGKVQVPGSSRSVNINGGAVLNKMIAAAGATRTGTPGRPPNGGDDLVAAGAPGAALIGLVRRIRALARSRTTPTRATRTLERV